MENGGIRPEAKVTTALDGSKNMAIAAAVNTGTPMSNKDSCYERFPHYYFYHCYGNYVPLCQKGWFLMVTPMILIIERMHLMQGKMV
ncbi:hypothetical protein Hdeb2414_s0010g00332661 [Helianthus debilis subsp. tardiflorus]